MSTVYEALEKAEIERNKLKILREEETDRPEFRKEVLSLPTRQFDVPSFPLFKTGSLAAEQFRKLRTTLIKRYPMKTVMVTSALQEEGKTFVSANLAVGIAFDLNRYALLVDCDLRNPSLGKHFGLTEGKGLSDFLLGGESIANLITPTKLERLNVIPGGSIPVNPSELVGSKRMEAMVEEVKSRYEDRFIIFDTTPILATSEPEILAKLVDGIILVVRAGFTPRDTVQRAISLIGKDKLLGIILNQVEFKSSGLFKKYFGSNGYYDSYGYGRDRGKAK